MGASLVTYQVSIYNQDIEPSVQSVLATITLNAAVDSGSIGRDCFFRFQGELYGYSYSSLRLYRITSPGLAGVIASSAVPVLVTGAIVNSADELCDRLWMGTLAAGTVYSWDGKYLGTDATALGTGPLIMATYHESILAFGTNYCKKRAVNGTWETVAMPGGLTSFVPRCKAVYMDNLYVGGYDNGATYPGIILRYNGSSLAIARTLVSGNTNPSYAGVTALHVFNGSLYYGYQQLGSGRVCKLGRFDNSSWTDTEKNFSPNVDLAIGAMDDYRGSLVVGFSNADLYESPGTTTTGTYTLLAFALVPGTGGIFDMIPSV